MLVDKSTRSLVVKVKQPELLVKQLPGRARIFEYEGTTLVQVKHTMQTAKILNNMGIEAPSPIRYYYDFLCPPGIDAPYDHQIDTSEFATLWRRCHILNGMGTGKTASVIWASDYLMQQGLVTKVLIAAPLSTLNKVWSRQIFDFAMHRRAVVLHGSRERRLALLDADVDFYIINFEGLEVISRELHKRKDINLYIVDEAAAYREAKNVRYEILSELTNPDRYPKRRLWLMTGTPTPNAPTDAWALAKLVDASKVPPFFSAFRRQTMYQKNMFKWVPREGSHKTVFAALQPGIRFRKKDCITLPPLTYESREARLTKAQKSALKDMRNEMVMEAASGVTITAINAADKVIKLLQILCGAVKDPETDTYIPIDHKYRLDVLFEFIEQAEAKVIVVVPWKGIIRVLAEEVAKRYTCDVVNGDVPLRQRDEIFTAFAMEEDPRVLLCHPKVMAHGLTLTEADTLIFYGPVRSNEQTLQVIERINRPGQTRKMTIGRIGSDPLEWDAYKVIESREMDQETMLDLYNREIKRVTRE